MVLVPYFVQDGIASSMFWDHFIGGKVIGTSLNVASRDTNLFFLYNSFGEPRKKGTCPLFSKYVLHRLVELVCARSILFLPLRLVRTHKAEIEAIHKEINYITGCIHFAAIAHEMFGHVLGGRVSDELKTMLSEEMEWTDRVVNRITYIIDKYKYNPVADSKQKICVPGITLSVMSADGRPFVCTVTQYVATFLDAFVLHKTELGDDVSGIIAYYFPLNVVCIGRAFLPRLASVTLGLKSIIVPHVGADERHYHNAYKNYFAQYKSALDEQTSVVAREVSLKLSSPAKEVIVIDE